MSTNSFDLLPNKVQNKLLTAFSSSAKAYGQINSSFQNENHCRTVHIHLDEEKRFFINTHKSSRKFSAAQKQMVCNGCYWDISQNIQFAWQAKLKVAKTDAVTKNAKWNLMRNEVKLAYFLDLQGIDLHSNTYLETFDFSQSPSNHAVVYLEPFEWDIFYVNTQEHRLSSRTILRFSEKQWHQKPSSILYT